MKRGQKAIELCMPVTVKRTVREQGPEGNDIETEIPIKRFVFRRNWFMCHRQMGKSIRCPPFRSESRGYDHCFRGWLAVRITSVAVAFDITCVRGTKVDRRFNGQEFSIGRTQRG